MRPVLAADLRSSLGCLSVRLWVPLISHSTVWAYASVSLWQDMQTYDVVSHLFPELVLSGAPHRRFVIKLNPAALHVKIKNVVVFSEAHRCGVCCSELMFISHVNLSACYFGHVITIFCLLCLPSDRTGKRSTMPDSPADVKTQSRLTPPTMPPPPSTQGAPRNSSYTPTTCE